MSFTFRNFINWLYEGVEDKLATISLKTKIPIEKLQQIFEGDPTPNKQYVNWLVKLYINKNLRFPEDKERSIEVLNSFNKIKNNPQFKSQYSNDIGQYKSIQDLWEAIRRFQGINVERKSYEGLLPEGATEIYKDNIYRVINVTTPQAAEIMFKNSEWCVRHKETAENYLENSILTLMIKSNYNYALIAVKSGTTLFLTTDYKNVEDEAPSLDMINELHPIWIKAGVLPSKAIYDKIPILCFSEIIPSAIYYTLLNRPPSDVVNNLIITNKSLEQLIGDVVDDICYRFGYYIPDPDFENHIFPVDENNKLHSQKGPAIFDADCYTGDDIELWYNHGKLHRNNGPAVNGVRGKVWAKNGIIIKVLNREF